MSMRFVARNGAIVTVDGRNKLTVLKTKDDGGVTRISFDNTGAKADALREFYQRQSDNELGRWRWDENADFVIYADPNDEDAVRVFNERSGAFRIICRGVPITDGFGGAAAAYFG